MVILKRHIGENLKGLKEQKKKINQKITELKDKEKPKCSFCFKELITNRNNYLKNRYKCKFWNNNLNDKRNICFPCLKYAYTRGLPLIASGEYGGKKAIFAKYKKSGMF